MFALVGGLAVNTINPMSSWLPWLVWPATVMLSLIMGVVEVSRLRLQGATPPGDARPRVDEAADQLAEAVHKQWLREKDHRKVDDPLPLPVRWHLAADQVVDHWANIHHAGPGVDPGPIALAGQLAEIAHLYRRIPSGRLVILGKAGAGKTILVARLALDLLTSRQPGHPVPVIFSIASWDPANDIADWLAGQLIRDHPGLAAMTADEQSLAAALVNAGLVLPILDGFDELPHRLQRPALVQLNTAPRMPCVITSRPTEYATAVAGTDVLTAAAGIELDDLTRNDLADYLPRTTRRSTVCDGHPTGLWNPVLAHLHQHPDDPATRVVRRALSTPLMVYLARTIYSDTPGHNPVDLLDTNRFPDSTTVEEHLIAAYVPAIYQRPATGESWQPEQARRWLAYLARHLSTVTTHDLAWWQLRDSIPLPVRIVIAALLFGLPVGLAFGLALGLAAGATVGILGGPTSGLAFGIACGAKASAPTRTHPRLYGRLYEVTAKILVGLTIGITGGLAGGFLSTLVGALIGVLAFAAAVGLAVLLAGAHPTLPKLLGVLAGSTASGLAGGLACGPAASPSFGLAAGLAFGLAYGLETPLDIATAASPAHSLANDRRNAVRKIITAGLAAGLPIGLSGGLAFGLSAMLAASIAAGLSTSAWGHWLVLVRIWLPLSGHLPWHVERFLYDAHRRGVLRQTGAVYQFRHARLQHHLATWP